MMAAAAQTAVINPSPDGPSRRGTIRVQSSVIVQVVAWPPANTARLRRTVVCAGRDVADDGRVVRRFWLPRSPGLSCHAGVDSDDGLRVLSRPPETTWVDSIPGRLRGTPRLRWNRGWCYLPGARTSRRSGGAGLERPRAIRGPSVQGVEARSQDHTPSTGSSHRQTFASPNPSLPRRDLCLDLARD